MLLSLIKFDFRVILHVNPEDCHQSANIAESIANDAKQHRICALKNSIELFAIAGGFLLVITVGLYFISRYYVLKLMSLKGINSSDDFVLYLEVSFVCHV